jgi:hypothetical protein
VNAILEDKQSHNDIQLPPVFPGGPAAAPANWVVNKLFQGVIREAARDGDRRQVMNGDAGPDAR